MIIQIICSLWRRIVKRKVFRCRRLVGRVVSSSSAKGEREGEKARREEEEERGGGLGYQVVHVAHLVSKHFYND